MNIQLIAIRREDVSFQLIKKGDSVLINGEEFDFSGLEPGASLPSTAISGDWFLGDQVSSGDGVKTLTVLMPVPANFSPEQTNAALMVDVPDGAVSLPQPLPIPEPAVEPEA